MNKKLHPYGIPVKLGDYNSVASYALISKLTM